MCNVVSSLHVMNMFRDSYNQISLVTIHWIAVSVKEISVCLLI